jgi:hypothetical protein
MPGSPVILAQIVEGENPVPVRRPAALLMPWHDAGGAHGAQGFDIHLKRRCKRKGGDGGPVLE